MPGPGFGDPDALVAALIELGRHVGRNGWDTPPDLTRDLAHLEWPEMVYGCALATVRMFLPSTTDVELPADPEAAAAAVARHPQRQEIRVVVGADRAANRHGLARLAAQPKELLGAPGLVPGLAAALAHTLS